jgi:hypothetical protein
MRPLALASALALTALVPRPSGAAHTGTCQAGFNGTAVITCYFWVRGLPTTIHAYGTSTTAGKPSQVHIWADAELNYPPVPKTFTSPFLECSATAPTNQEAACADSLSIGVPRDSTKQLYLVDCHVQGGVGTKGIMTCTSGTGG